VTPRGTPLRRIGGAARSVLLGALLPLLVLLLWHLASRGSTTIPAIPAVVDVLVHPFRDPPTLDSRSLGESVLVSLVRVLVGFGAAALVAVPLGILVGRIRWVRQVFQPILETMRPICPVAWIPVAIVVIGFTSLGSVLYGKDAWKHGLLDEIQLAMVAVIAWGAFFPVFVNTAHGVTHIRSLLVEVAVVNGASRRQVFRHVILPAALPAIVAGLRIGMGTAWMVIVAAEFFPGTSAGVGYMITESHEVTEYQYCFASIIAIGLLGLLLNALLSRLEKRVGRWQTRER
jgi:NitT/TauT family transport system permease protein